MADTKWVKIAVDMFNDSKLKIIDDREDNNLIHYIWTRSILLAGSINKDGYLYINDNIPFTLKTLAIEFNRTLEEVKSAIKVLIKLEMIELTEEKIYKIKHWQRHQNIEGLERIRKQTNERVAKYREKKKQEKKAAENKNEYELNNEEEVLDESTDNEEVKNNEEETNEKLPAKVYAININNDSPVTCNGDNNNLMKNVTPKKENKNKNNKIKEIEKESVLNSAIELSNYCDSLTGKISSLEMGALRLAINMHTKANVKRAIDKAIEVGKCNMNYINGILMNWRREGYPEENYVGGISNGAKYSGKGIKSDSNKYSHVKPKKPRSLSEEERKQAELELI